MKILILSASTGAGHMSAANAIKSYTNLFCQNAEVKVVDTLSYISSILNKTVVEGYQYMALKTPKLFGAVYNATNKDNALKNAVSTLNNQFGKKLLPLLDSFNPDVILCTHPFPTEMVSNLKFKNKITQPLVCLMTDYSPHKTWINKNVDAYIVATDEMKKNMISLGVASKKIFPFGIPVKNDFYKSYDKKETLKKADLSPDIPTILIMAGSMGATQIFKLYKKIVNIEFDFQMIVITGHNRQLYKSFKNFLDLENDRILAQQIQKIKEKGFEKFSNLKISKRLPSRIQKIDIPDFLKPKKFKKTKLIFFTTKVAKYMQCSDFIITKPGGLTVTEALVSNTPLVLFDAIPGPEDENADFLIKNFLAKRISETDNAHDTVRELLENRDTLNKMKKNSEKICKKNSQEKIINLLKKISKSS